MNLILSQLFRGLAIASFCLLLYGCHTNKDIYKGLSAETIYNKAQMHLKKENFSNAAKDLEALEARYPYSDYSNQAQLDLIYSYYKSNEPALGLSTANRFIRMNPHHPHVDYAYYLKGLINFEQNYSFSFRYLPLDKSTRDPTAAQVAFESFKTLIDRFANSPYANDAKKRMVFLRNLLANHELNIMQYYIKRSAYLSALNRAHYILQHFAQTPAVPKALLAMAQCYRKLGLHTLADNVLKTRQANFPQESAD